VSCRCNSHLGLSSKSKDNCSRVDRDTAFSYRSLDLQAHCRQRSKFSSHGEHEAQHAQAHKTAAGSVDALLRTKFLKAINKLGGTRISTTSVKLAVVEWGPFPFNDEGHHRWCWHRRSECCDWPQKSRSRCQGAFAANHERVFRNCGAE
jgi:hypothetical protein